jgi:hypothetical protein
MLGNTGKQCKIFQKNISEGEQLRMAEDDE